MDKLTPEKICSELNLDLTKVLNIYPYGSKVYGTAVEDSDDDFVIVFKGSLLPSGAFKDNAISNKDWTIQGVCYSRSGFIDALNNYQINALECIFLPEEKIVKQTMPFKLQKLDLKEMAKKIITTASSSWHFASLAYKDDHIDSAKKNVFHALRILDFGIQIRNHGKIVDYSSMNEVKFILNHTGDFKPKHYNDQFIELQAILRGEKADVSRETLFSPI